jgi:3-dehydroquinate synthase II
LSKIDNKNLICKVNSIEEARTASKVFERGVGGLYTDDELLAYYINDELNNKIELKLSTARITEIIELGIGDRALIDTISLLPQEGMLVSNVSGLYFLVQSESINNEFVNQRPFRVNAGATCNYILTSTNSTAYLSELCGGSNVLVTDYYGNARIIQVGRNKIEKRPCLMIKSGDYNIVLQNAETIYLVKEDGNPISIKELSIGDKLIVYKTHGGTHGGVFINESIIEK